LFELLLKASEKGPLNCKKRDSRLFFTYVYIKISDSLVTPVPNVLELGVVTLLISKDKTFISNRHAVNTQLSCL